MLEAAPLDDLCDRFPAPVKQDLDVAQRQAYDVIEQRRGRLPAPYTALLGSPAVAEAFDQLSGALQQGGLPPSVLEAVFLMKARRHCCRYLWINHVGKARAAGLDEKTVVALGQGRIPDAPAAVRVAAHFEHVLAEQHRVPQPLYEDAAAELGARGLVDLMVFCGFASSVALILNVRQPETPAGAEAPF
jgi:4-carboxymuconolactone decarboxylase